MIGAGPGRVVSLSQHLHYSPAGRLLSRTLPDGTRIAYRYYADTPGQPGTGGQLAAIEQIRWPGWLDWLMTRLPESWQPKTVLAQLAPNSQATPLPGNAPPVSAPGDAGKPQARIEPGLSPDAPGEQFDSAGLPHRLSTATGRLQLAWNAAGQLAQVSDAGGKTLATYRYDARGRRASKTTARGSEFYLYDGAQLIATAADGNGPEKNPSPIRITGQYLYQGYRPVAWLKPRRGDGLWHTLLAWIKWSDTAAYALATDHRGAVLAVTTLATDPARRKTLWQSHINAWGAAQASAPATLDPGLRLVNQYADAETGLSYNLARYYDPKAGRFISPDPAGVADSIDSQTPNALKLDITVYASGQPYLFFDPDAAAKMTYYAITTGDRGGKKGYGALGTTQGFTKARWAFVITDIQAAASSATKSDLITL
ncbi:MAG: RHS repeat-associated core domain-containing protein [Halothiobacillus sp.]